MAIPAFTLANRLHAGETGILRLVRPALSDRRRNARPRRLSGGHARKPARPVGPQRASSPASPRFARAARRRSCACRSAISPLVSRALDFGAEGIIAPMINTPADARAFAAAAKYPPIGERSWGPHRATTLAGLSDQSVYLREANDHVVTLAMIETRTALQNLDAIVDTPGIDGLLPRPVGSVDRAVGRQDSRSAVEGGRPRARHA